MLNHLWIALIALGILTAVGFDIRNEVVNPYRNGMMLQATFVPEKKPGPLRSSWEGLLIVPGGAFAAFYGMTPEGGEVRQMATLDERPAMPVIALTMNDMSPSVWREMGKASSTKDRLVGRVSSIVWDGNRQTADVRFMLEPIRFVRLRAVTQATFDYASMAVTIAIGLVGVMALWLGVMKIAEEAGLLRIVALLLRPLMRRLFPEVPSDHPAIGAIIMNIAANMLGLSNAATPLGLKAMEELNKLNPKVGTATNAMVTFLAINTGGLILIPATALAVRAASGSGNPGIIIGTSIVGAGCATVAGVIASKVLERLPRYRKAVEVSHE